MTGGSRGGAVALLLTHETSEMVLSPAGEGRLGAAVELRRAAGPASEWDLPSLLRGARACVTGWGTPSITHEVLNEVPDLAFIAHTAGSIRNLLPLEAVGSRVRVSHAAALIAESVAEMVVLQILSGVRELHQLDRGLREGEQWRELRRRHPGRLVGALTVGVIGASRTGRAVIGLLRAFGSRILLADPTVGAAGASGLGVELVDLGTLLERSDAVTIHAPLLPSTRGLLGRAELARLRDGALLVNSARAGLVDGDALLDELRSGRIRAALDVFPEEPLLPGSVWRDLPGAILSPHAAGHTRDGHHRQGAAMVDEVLRFLAGRPLHYEVTADVVEMLA